MYRCGIAIGLSSVLLLIGVAASQSSATPEAQAASQSPPSENHDAPCQPRTPTVSTPFDTCKYWPFVPGPGIHAPRALHAPNPEYSETARKAKANGTVVVALAINEKGGVDGVKVVRHLEHGLDQNAMNAARQWEFAPATKDGEPMAVQLSVEMTFQLH